MTIRGLLVLLLFVTACSSQEQADFKSAEKEAARAHYRIALGHFDQVIKRNKTRSYVLNSLREAARISFFELHDYERAISYYRQLTLKSPDPLERMNSQKQIAQIYFDSLQNYQASIAEFDKLLQLKLPAKDTVRYRINIARAWFYINNMYQASSEVESLLKGPLSPDARFEVLLLKGNILVAQKNYKEAADQFISLIESDPVRSTKENVILTLAVCYEENYELKAAIQVLEKYKASHSQPDYIDIRIKRLKERMKNAPGARGMRK